MVREYEKNHPLEEAIELAVKYCIDNDILREYLEQQSTEVKNMLTEEFNLEEYKAVARWEGIAEGMEKGEKKVQNYILDLIEQGFSREEIKMKIEEMSKNNGSERV